MNVQFDNFGVSENPLFEKHKAMLDDITTHSQGYFEGADRFSDTHHLFYQTKTGKIFTEADYTDEKPKGVVYVQVQATRGRRNVDLVIKDVQKHTPSAIHAEIERKVEAEQDAEVYKDKMESAVAEAYAKERIRLEDEEEQRREAGKARVEAQAKEAEAQAKAGAEADEATTGAKVVKQMVDDPSEAVKEATEKAREDFEASRKESDTINTSNELLERAILGKVVDKKNNYYLYKDKKFGHGTDEAVKTLAGDDKLRGQIEKEVEKLLS